MDFVEICNVYIGKMIIKAAKRIFNSDKMCRSYRPSDLNFGVTFLEHSVFVHVVCDWSCRMNYEVSNAVILWRKRELDFKI